MLLVHRKSYKRLQVHICLLLKCGGRVCFGLSRNLPLGKASTFALRRKNKNEEKGKNLAKMIKSRKAVLIGALALACVLFGYVLAEYTFTFTNTMLIRATTTLDVRWVATNLTVTSYDWGEMNDVQKYAPLVTIKNVGNNRCSVKWNTTNLPANMQLTAMNWVPSLDWPPESTVSLEKDANFTVRFTLKDLGCAVGSYGFSINIDSLPA
jgi:hypothetical protein